jgi:acetoin utilization deacetylase AcuC-like enzyme
MTRNAPYPVATRLETGAAHAFPGHPESPARFSRFDDLIFSPLGDRLLQVESDPASLDSVLRVHSENHLDRIEAALADAPAYLDHGDTYVTSESLKMALRSAGAALAVLRAVLDGRALMGFSLGRPPGHHATADRAMGFCLLNNVAIAAREAQLAGAERVAIIDFDVHHGNGTQSIFESDGDVLYLSTHQFGIYPGTGALDERGTGEGVGSTINLPLPAGAGENAFEAAARLVIAPAVARHDPDLILVSAGFDAHWRDPLASLQLSGTGFHRLTQAIVELASHKPNAGPVFCLEGGYEPEALACCVSNTLRAMLDLPNLPEPWERPNIEEPDISGLLNAAARMHGL